MTLHRLNTAIERARDRHRYALRNYGRAKQELDPNDPMQARTLRKLESDFTAAERDLSYALGALDNAREVEGLNL